MTAQAPGGVTIVSDAALDRAREWFHEAFAPNREHVRAMDAAELVVAVACLIDEARQHAARQIVLIAADEIDYYAVAPSPEAFAKALLERLGRVQEQQ